MIKFENDFYVKNIGIPKTMEITVKAGINDSYYCKNTVISVDLSPVKFIKGGVNSTGIFIIDIKNYICSIMDNIIKNCYFDVNNPNDDELRIRINNKFIQLFSNSMNITASEMQKINCGFSEIIESKILLSKLEHLSLFNVFIIAIDTDMERFNDFDSKTAFLSAFSSENVTKNTLHNTTDSNNNSVISVKYASLNFDVIEFCNLLIRIFNYYFSQSYRDFVTGESLHLYNVNMRSPRVNEEVMIWDNISKKYFPMSGEENFRASYIYFTVANLSNTIKRAYKAEKEMFDRINPLEYNRICKDDENVVMTKINNIELIYNDKVFNYNCYVPYLNKEGNGEAVSISLYAKMKGGKEGCANIINSFFRRKASMYMLDYYGATNYENALKELENVTYDELTNDRPLQEIIDNKMLDFGCEICYYTKGGGRTYFDYSELKDKKIPKQRRDLIFKALCELCIELDVDIYDVLAELDVEFKRYYSAKDIALYCNV